MHLCLNLVLHALIDNRLAAFFGQSNDLYTLGDRDANEGLGSLIRKVSAG